MPALRPIRDVERQQRDLVDQLTNLGGSVASLVTEKLTALDVRVILYRAGHTPRWEITASLPLDVSTTAPVVNAASSRSATP